MPVLGQTIAASLDRPNLLGPKRSSISDHWCHCHHHYRLHRLLRLVHGFLYPSTRRDSDADPSWHRHFEVSQYIDIVCLPCWFQRCQRRFRPRCLGADLDGAADLTVSAIESECTVLFGSHVGSSAEHKEDVLV